MSNYFYTYFKEVDLKKDYASVICGPDSLRIRKQFKENYLFFDLDEMVFSKKLLLKSFILFLKLIIKTRFSYKNFRVSLAASLIVPVIKHKSIKKIICFMDYSIIGKVLKQILKEEVTLIGFQHSMRDNRTDRNKLIEGYDHYFLWDDYKNKLISKKKNLIKFGALKSYIILEKYKKWHYLKKNFTKSKTLVLISTFAKYNQNFDKIFLNNLNKEQKIKKVNSIYNKFKNKKLFLNNYERQSLEYFVLCDSISKFIKKYDFKLIIIGRNFKNRFKENKTINFVKSEQIFFKFFFNNFKIINLDFFKRLNKAIEFKDSIFITNISSFGKEIMAMNYKAIFYSFLTFSMNPGYYDKKSLFCCLKKNESKFFDKIIKLNNLSFQKYIKEKKTNKKSFLSFEPNKLKFQKFLNLTGLKLKN